MNCLGETISLGVAASWTVTAMVAEVASKRIGPQVLNVWRMLLSLLFLGVMLWIVTGSFLPSFADQTTWTWLLLSGAVGYVFGDFCLFNSYLYIGSRWGQLFMMLAPIAASLTAWILLDEALSLKIVIGIAITLTGIAISVINRQSDEVRHKKFAFKIPIKGILFGIGAGVGQGIGLVLSKVGMEHYALCIPSDSEGIIQTMPFAATMMRATAGLIGLGLILLLRGEGPNFVRATRDKKGMFCTLLATVTGPFIGVSFSLMAVLYTSAGVAQTLMSLTPILILWPSHVFFHQRITWLEVLGATISIFGVSLFFL